MIDDMLPFTFQIQTLSNGAIGLATRVAKVENESWEDDEKTFPELQARIAKTIAFLEKIPASAIDDKEDAEVILKMRCMSYLLSVWHDAWNIAASVLGRSFPDFSSSMSGVAS